MFPVFNSQQEYLFSLMQANQGLVQQSGSTIVAGMLSRHAKPAALGRWKRHLALIEMSWGDLQVLGVEPKHVVKLRDARASKPADANNLLRTLSAFFTWCALRGWRPDNPCRLVPKFKIGDGWAPWPWDAIEHFRQNARTDLWEAAALALYTGQRLSDVLVMAWADIDGRLISVVQSKTGKRLWVPIHRELKHVLTAIEMRRRPEDCNVIPLQALPGTHSQSIAFPVRLRTLA